MKLKKWIASAAACVMAVCSCLTVLAADSPTYSLFQAGNSYTLVGKGAEDNSIVINLEGKSEVTSVYYAVTSVPLSKPDYMVEVEDVPGKNQLDVKVVYNEALNMYGIKVTAKDLINGNFVVKYLKRIGNNYQAVALKTVNIMVIDGDDYVSPEEISEENYSAYRSQAAATNVLEGLSGCADGQSIVVDISDTNRISNAWLKTLKKYPSKSLICAGEDYSWTVKGSDINSTSGYLSHYMGVSMVAANQEELEQASGIKNIRPVVISGMKKFPASAKLTVHLAGQSYKGAIVNVYKYENGKVMVVAQDVQCDSNGNLSFKVTSGGTYLVSQLKSPNAA